MNIFLDRYLHPTSKLFCMHHPTDRITHTTVFGTPVVGHWLEREIAEWVDIYFVAECDRPVVVVGARSQYNGTDFRAAATYVCEETAGYYYHHGNHTAWCGDYSTWRRASLKCASERFMSFIYIYIYIYI